ncbi:Maf1 regulator-domain-containing protein [Peziza echinospora]|nr:Maf1 regulator-domain-containing protein [Peziza echinospora]
MLAQTGAGALPHRRSGQTKWLKDNLHKPTFKRFLPIQKVEQLNRLLNFETSDCRVEGGCDIYTTKAAGVDKKLYKSIERDLETRHEADLRLSASLSPPHDSSALLSRNSPFGPLDQPAARRTFAYLIATLNASHPDYDFSGILRPSDFRRERALRTALSAIDTTLFNLSRPIPKLWATIDQEMTLRECLIYQYIPEDGEIYNEDGLIWSLNYFFYNKLKKRVCYLYLKGASTLNGSSFGGSEDGEDEVMGGVGGRFMVRRGGVRVGGRRGSEGDSSSWDEMEYEGEYDDEDDWVGNMDV